MAVVCQELSVHIHASPDELFACGLLTRIGCLALAAIYPSEYAELLAQQDAGSSLLELEREYLHIDHNELTTKILTACSIPVVLVKPVYHHEAPEDSGFTEGSQSYRLVHLFYHAKRLADLGLMPETEGHSKTSELLLLGDKIGLDTDKEGGPLVFSAISDGTQSE